MFAFAIAAPAQAQVTATQIGAPAKTRFVLYDTSAAHPKTLDGRRHGDRERRRRHRLLCAARRSCRCSRAWTSRPTGRSRRQTFRSPRPPTRPTPKPGPSCRLRAVPAGTTPAADDPASRGRCLASASTRSCGSRAGDNDGRRAGYYLYAAGTGYSAEAGAVRRHLRAVDRDPGSADARAAGRRPHVLRHAAQRLRSAGLRDRRSAGVPACRPQQRRRRFRPPGRRQLPGIPPEPTVQFDEDTGDASVTETSAWRGARPTTRSHRACGPARASIARRSR